MPKVEMQINGSCVEFLFTLEEGSKYGIEWSYVCGGLK